MSRRPVAAPAAATAASAPAAPADQIRTDRRRIRSGCRDCAEIKDSKQVRDTQRSQRRGSVAVRRHRRHVPTPVSPACSTRHRGRWIAELLRFPRTRYPARWGVRRRPPVRSPPPVGFVRHLPPNWSGVPVDSREVVDADFAGARHRRFRMSTCWPQIEAVRQVIGACMITSAPPAPELLVVEKTIDAASGSCWPSCAGRCPAHVRFRRAHRRGAGPAACQGSRRNGGAARGRRRRDDSLHAGRPGGRCDEDASTPPTTPDGTGSRPGSRPLAAAVAGYATRRREPGNQPSGWSITRSSVTDRVHSPEVHRHRLAPSNTPARFGGRAELFPSIPTGRFLVQMHVAPLPGPVGRTRSSTAASGWKPASNFLRNGVPEEYGGGGRPGLPL